MLLTFSGASAYLFGARTCASGGVWTGMHHLACSVLVLEKVVGLKCRRGIVDNLELPVAAKVLLVDDEWRQLEVRACVLSMVGFPVLTARGPFEALSLANRFKELDVAVVDYEMPFMNGATLAERLKSKLPKLNVVLYSAAVTIPSGDLQRVDSVISKCEGVSALLCHLWALSAELRGNRYCGEAAALHHP
jgi:CheY-like chemotaxis protein